MHGFLPSFHVSRNMLLSGPLMVGHFGKLRGVHGFVGAGLPSDFVDRWDNWYLMATRRTPLGAIAYDEPAWRFVAAAGLFGHFAAAGVWQRSQDCDGQIYPFVIAVLGASLADDDPWFDATQSLLTVVVDGENALDAALER